MSSELIFLGGFLALVLVMLALDLGVTGRRDHVVGLREALVWTGVWIATAGLFYLFLLLRGEFLHGVEAVPGFSEGSVSAEALRAYRGELSLEFLTGYLIEKALSVDNIFVMIMILLGFGVEEKYYHKVLLWGVLGAIVMRFGFIFLASALVERFAWVLWVFGAFLLFTGGKMLLSRGHEERIDVECHPVVRAARRLGIGPLLTVVIMIEFSDVIFAVDSIPAIFAVTTDPYIVFFSNIFAILGLRSLFFVLVGVMGRFAYLKTGLAVLLAFIGAKMLLHGVFHVSISTAASLMVIVGILAASIGASLIFPKNVGKIRE